MTDAEQTPNLTIEREDTPERGRYVIHLAPGFEAELTYSRGPGGVLTLDHTGVPPAYEGRGIAARLVDRLVADAREQGFKVIPVCPYVVAQFRRHPEWGDLLA